MICRHTTVAAPLRGRRGASLPLRGRSGQPGLRFVAPRRVKHQTIACANAESSQPDNEQPAHTEGARQLLGVTALAFFSFVAILAKDRATSPIVPPLIPPITTLTSAPAVRSDQPSNATATAERPDVEPSDAPRTQVKPSRSLLRTLWGTATLPVKLVDALLFPEEPLVGSAPSKQVPTAHSTTAAVPAPAAAAPSSDGLSATLPAADPAAAAAGEALSVVAQQIDALAEAGPELPAVQHKPSTAQHDFLLQLQDAVRRLAQQQQQQQESVSSTPQPAGSADSTAAAALDTAATMAALRVLLGPDAMSLLPVVLVTAATAAAGLLLAASIAGVAGLVDRRRAATPAQRAAEAALFDSPLRPISCPTWPGFLPMLPPSLEPTFYRMRDASPTTAADAADASVDDRKDAAGVSSGSSGASASAAGQDASSSSSAAAQVATAATVLAMLGAFVAPGAAGLLPVVLVTSGSAAAGLLLAASIAGVAGLVDRRRVLTPAQRAAEAALLDSPLRPISCPTMPGILPSLPASMEPIFYRWRETEPAASSAAAGADGGSSTSSTSTPDEAVSTGSREASTIASSVREHPLDQEWWSFAQIQALRLMPLLSEGRHSGKAGAGSAASKAVAASCSASAQAAEHGAAAAPKAAAPAAAAQTEANAAAAAAAADSSPSAQAAEQGAAAGPKAAAPAAAAEAEAAAAVAAADSSSSAQETEHGAAAPPKAAAPAAAAQAEAAAAAAVADSGSSAQAAERGAAAAPKAAATAAAAQAEAEAAAAAACASFLQQSPPLVNPKLVQVALRTLDGLQGLEPAWEVAVTAVAAYRGAGLDAFAADYGHQCSAAVLLRDFGSTAPARLLAEVCALVPAAAANFDAAAVAAASTGGGTGTRQADTGRSSWRTAERLLAALLQPAGGASRVREVCREMGLFWEGPFDGTQALSGVLQHWAKQSQQAADQLQSVSSCSWGPAGTFVQDWLAAAHKAITCPADVALRSCCMAAYFAMELWYAQPAGPLAAKDSSSSSSCKGGDVQPAVVFSHYELLQQLKDGSGDASVSALAAVIVKASEWAAAPRYRNSHQFGEGEYYSFHGEPLFACEGPSREEVRAAGLLIRNGSTDTLFRGKFPSLEDVAAWSSIRQCLAQVQQASPQLLTAAGEGLSAGAAMSEGQLIERVVEALLRGEQVVSVPIWEPLCQLHSIAAAEWVAAAQLAQLCMILPKTTAKSLLDHMAVGVEGGCLARVCALLPAASQNYGSRSRPSDNDDGPVDYQTDLLPVLAAGPASAAGSAAAGTAAMLRDMGMLPGVAAAAAEAASGAAGSSWERINAALAAVQAAGGWLSASEDGLLQQLWQGDCKADRPAREIGTCSVLVAAAALLDAMMASDAAAGPHAAGQGMAAGGWGQGYSGGSLPLPLKSWVQLATRFASLELKDTPGRAAVAALLAQGLLAAQDGEGQGPQPAAFRNSLLHILSNCGGPSNKSSLFEGEPLFGGEPLAIVSYWYRKCAPAGDAATFGPMPLTRRGGLAAAGAEAGADAAGPAAAGGAGADAAGQGKAEEWGDWGAYTIKGDLQVPIEWPEPQVPSCAEIRVLGWADGWGVAGEEGTASQQSSRKKKGKQQKSPSQQKPANQHGQQGSRRQVVAAAHVMAVTARPAATQQAQQQTPKPTRPRSRSSSKSPSSTVTTRTPASAAAPPKAAVAEVGVQEAPVQGKAEADLVPTVKELLGLPVDPSDRAGSGELVPNRLTLLLCQAMLLRGEESQAKLQAAVGYLAAAQQTEKNLTHMLAGCMEALFTTQDWDSPTGSARQVMATLSAALPPASYKRLQQRLKAKGLIRDVEV